MQIEIFFEGSASSQEINGSYASVPCGKVFSNTSTVTLGAGCTSQFTSPSTLRVRAVGRWLSACVSTATPLARYSKCVQSLERAAPSLVDVEIADEQAC